MHLIFWQQKDLRKKSNLDIEHPDRPPSTPHFADHASLPCPLSFLKHTVLCNSQFAYPFIFAFIYIYLVKSSNACASPQEPQRDASAQPSFRPLIPGFTDDLSCKPDAQPVRRCITREPAPTLTCQGLQMSAPLLCAVHINSPGTSLSPGFVIAAKESNCVALYLLPHN